MRQNQFGAKLIYLCVGILVLVTAEIMVGPLKPNNPAIENTMAICWLVGLIIFLVVLFSSAELPGYTTARVEYTNQEGNLTRDIIFIKDANPTQSVALVRAVASEVRESFHQGVQTGTSMMMAQLEAQERRHEKAIAVYQSIIATMAESFRPVCNNALAQMTRDEQTKIMEILADRNPVTYTQEKEILDGVYDLVLPDGRVYSAYILQEGKKLYLTPAMAQVHQLVTRKQEVPFILK